MGDSLRGRSFGSPKFCKRKFSFLYGFCHLSFVFLLLKYTLNVVKLQVSWSVLGDKIFNFRCHGCDQIATVVTFFLLLVQLTAVSGFIERQNTFDNKVHNIYYIFLGNKIKFDLIELRREIAARSPVSL